MKEAIQGHTAQQTNQPGNCCDARCAGPTTLDAGPVTVALHLTSLGHNELILAGLEERHSYSDFEAYLEESPGAITERPSWVTEIVTLELEHGGGERDGISEELDLPEGT